MVNSTAGLVVLLRNDLRLADNPALFYAAAESSAEKRPLTVLYVLDDAAPHALGAAKLWWLHYSLAELSKNLRNTYGAELVLRRGDTFECVSDVMRATGAGNLYWNRRYYHAERAVDEKLKTEFAGKSFNGALLVEPWEVAPKSGGDFCKVFTPFWKQCLTRDFAEPLEAPEQFEVAPAIDSDTLEDWALLPTAPDWSTGFAWEVGEDAAMARLDNFLQNGLSGYKELRNRPDLPHTSRLSPYLAAGNISPRQIYAAAENARGHAPENDINHFVSEIGWREFSYHLLYHLEDLPTVMLRGEFNDFPWSDNHEALTAWQRGQTGYPIVDAGMRELYATGWMHNRVRMIVASFLVKHLLIDWRAGEAWFWDCLVDADLGSNSASWQWVSGCGADAAPYFRIFNPIIQGYKFDPDGHYTKKWVPELKDVPNKQLFAPWELSDMELLTAGVKLGADYPHPIIKHEDGRERALAAYKSLKD